MSKNKPSWRKYTLAAVILLLLITAALAYICLTQEQNPDPASEEIIRRIVAKQLNKAPDNLTNEDFAKITKLRICSIELFDISGIYSLPIITLYISDIKILEKFVNLQELEFMFVSYPQNRIPQWMKILAKLGIYDLDEKFAIDLGPLKKLHNLEWLHLGGTPVKNISSLANLINLKQLVFTGNQLSNLETIKALKKLEVLSINSSRISSLDTVKSFPNLKELHIYSTQIADLEPIKNLKNLKMLYISNCPNITDEQVEDLQKALPELKIYR